MLWFSYQLQIMHICKVYELIWGASVYWNLTEVLERVIESVLDKWRLIQNRSNNALLPDMWIFAYTTVSDWRVYKLLQHFFITGGNVRNGFNIAI